MMALTPPKKPREPREARTPMDIARFTQLLDAYGAATERWPETERHAALSLLQANAQCRALLEDAQRLDAQLDALPEFAAPEIEMSPALRARVLEIPVRHPHAAKRKGWFNLNSLAFALVPCLIGFLSGTLLQDQAPDDEDEWTVAAFDLPDPGDVDDVFEEEE